MMKAARTSSTGKRPTGSGAKRAAGKAVTGKKATVARADASGRFTGATKHPKTAAKNASARRSGSARASASATANFDALLNRIHSDIDEADRLLEGAVAG